MTYSPTPTELLALKTANAALLNSPDAYTDFASTIVFALGSAQLLQSPETAAELARLRTAVADNRLADIAARRNEAEEVSALACWPVDEYRLVQQTLKDSAVLLAEVKRLRARVAELEAAAYGDAPVRLLEPAAQIRHLRDSLAAQMHRANTLNWICKEQRQRAKVAETRVAELEAAVETALADHQLFDDSAHCQHDGERWPCPTVMILVPAAPDAPASEACQRSAEDPYDSPLHHDYKTGRDLPDYQDCNREIGHTDGYLTNCNRCVGHDGACSATADTATPSEAPRV